MRCSCHALVNCGIALHFRPPPGRWPGYLRAETSLYYRSDTPGTALLTMARRLSASKKTLHQLPVDSINALNARFRGAACRDPSIRLRDGAIGVPRPRDAARAERAVLRGLNDASLSAWRRSPSCAVCRSSQCAPNADLADGTLWPTAKLSGNRYRTVTGRRPKRGKLGDPRWRPFA